MPVRLPSCSTLPLRPCHTTPAPMLHAARPTPCMQDAVLSTSMRVVVSAPLEAGALEASPAALCQVDSSSFATFKFSHSHSHIPTPSLTLTLAPFPSPAVLGQGASSLGTSAVAALFPGQVGMPALMGDPCTQPPRLPRCYAGAQGR